MNQNTLKDVFLEESKAIAQAISNINDLEIEKQLRLFINVQIMGKKLLVTGVGKVVS